MHTVCNRDRFGLLKFASFLPVYADIKESVPKINKLLL